MSLLPVRVVRLVLPYPPGVNEYWRSFTPKRGPARLIVSSIGRAYKVAVREMLALDLGDLMDGPLRLELDVFRPRRAGDVDRHLKVLLDVLQRDEEENWPGLYANDSQAYRVKVEHWDHEPRDPRVQLTVTEDANPRQPPTSWALDPKKRLALEAARERMAQVKTQERERVKGRKATKVEFKSLAQMKAKPASYPATKGKRR